MGVLVEAVVATVEDAVAAERAGAGRVELCAGLPTGGLTPTAGMLEEVLAAVSIPVACMVRPREGGFTATDAEWRVMIRDASTLAKTGAEGIVFAVVREDRSIDVERVREMVEAVGPTTAVFHRAFDQTPDLDRALDQLLSAGIGRLLTSGGAPTALEGASRLRSWSQRVDGRLALLAAGGVRASHAKELVERAGVAQVHLGPRRSAGYLDGGMYGGYQELDDDAIRAAVQAVS